MMENQTFSAINALSNLEGTLLFLNMVFLTLSLSAMAFAFADDHARLKKIISNKVALSQNWLHWSRGGILHIVCPNVNISDAQISVLIEEDFKKYSPNLIIIR